MKEKVKNKLLIIFGCLIIAATTLTIFITDKMIIELLTAHYLGFSIVFLIITLIPIQNRPSLQDVVKDKDFWLVMCYDFFR